MLRIFKDKRIANDYPIIEGIITENEICGYSAGFIKPDDIRPYKVISSFKNYKQNIRLIANEPNYMTYVNFQHDIEMTIKFTIRQSEKCINVIDLCRYVNDNVYKICISFDYDKKIIDIKICNDVMDFTTFQLLTIIPSVKIMVKTYLKGIDEFSIFINKLFNSQLIIKDITIGHELYKAINLYYYTNRDFNESFPSGIFFSDR